MIDIHLHILPELDDGAETMEDAIIMAELAVESGVKTAIATPHANIRGVFQNYYDDRLKKSFESFKIALKEKNIPLQLIEGMEIYGQGNIAELLKKGRIISLNSSRYILIEFPFHESAAYMNRKLEEVYYEGYVPIIAHPERYACVQEDMSVIFNWINKGYYIQLNKGSITGYFGKGCKITAFSLLNEGIVSFIASDAHNTYRRNPCLDGVRSLLEEYYPLEYIKSIFETNPMKVIQDTIIELR
ncbi:tyrosine-protein phosphatase [Alloiococcus sp. CFN-8]|uniref:tyrosine-protein phosphatase n=1 Tax=Alloiococcus sp. CFN-8 TaxID=3416081 RepID=UPI003CFAC7E1